MVALGCQRDSTSQAKEPGNVGGKRVAKGESNGDVVIHPNGGTYRVVNVANPGSVSGTVTLKNPPAAAALMPTGAFGAVCGATVVDESVQLSGKSLADVVVWLEGIQAGKGASPDRRLELESLQCKLHPRVQAGVTSSAVNVLGHDEFRQHLRFTAGGEDEPRTTVLLGGGEQVIPTNLPFKAPGLVLVRDPEHAWTRAYLAVFDHPYFAVTGANGSFTIDGVPPGTYTLHAWHERTGDQKQSVDIAPNTPLKLNLELSAK